jgi:hypothetical protein
MVTWYARIWCALKRGPLIAIRLTPQADRPSRKVSPSAPRRGAPCSRSQGSARTSPSDHCRCQPCAVAPRRRHRSRPLPEASSARDRIRSQPRCQCRRRQCKGQGPVQLPRWCRLRLSPRRPALPQHCSGRLHRAPKQRFQQQDRWVRHTDRNCALHLACSLLSDFST